MDSEAVVSRIEIKWWGQSRSRKFHVDIDNQRIINYNNEVNPGFNGWNKFDNIDASIKGSSIQFTLTDGVEDCWGGNRKLGIRELKIYGRYVAKDTFLSMRHILYSKFLDCLSDQATLLMLKFLATKIGPK